MKKIYYVFALLLTLLCAGFLLARQTAESVQGGSSGPEKGYLMLVGGGVSEPLWNKLKQLMGGSDQHLILIPTALNDDSLDHQFLVDYQARFHSLGFSNVTVLHTRNREIANSSSFVKPLSNAAAVWFSGGRQWRHADAYLNTNTHRALWDLLDRGGVIAGSSAGATIQGSYLARGDTKRNTIMVGDHEEGLGFLKNIAVDQHLLRRNRHFDMFEILEKYPELLGIGIDENTAIVVHGDRFQVIGDSYVAVYDGTRWSGERDTIYSLPERSRDFYFLSAGDEYDLARRKIVEFQDRVFIDLSREQRHNLVGRYQAEESDRRVEIFIENDSLKAIQQWNKERYPLLAESASRLFIPETSISFEFITDKNGKVLGFDVPAVDETFKKVIE